LSDSPAIAAAPDGTAFIRHTGADGASAEAREGDRPAVVLIHGLGLCQRLFDPMIAGFSAHFDLISYDLYGHGDSGPPPQTATLSLYSQQIAGLLDHLGIARAALVGFSIGGMINRRFALDHPDRLSALAIWNSPHDRGEQAQKLVEDRAAQVRAQGTMSTLPAAIERWFTPGFRASQPGRVDLVRQWRQRVDLEGYAQTAWVLAGGVPELVRPARAVTAPTLVMTAERDSGSTPAMAQAIAAEIPGARTEIVPDLQHLGLMEDPEAFAAPTLDFLKRTLL